MDDSYSFPVGDYPKPGVLRVQQLQEVAQYTDPDQFEFFRDWINWNNNNNCNVRFDPDDPNGTTIRWYWAYYLRLGDWLLGGLYPLSEESLRFSLAPQLGWPTTFTEQDLAPYYQNVPYPPTKPETEPVSGSGSGTGSGSGSGSVSGLVGGYGTFW